jgi:hypothetical protein
MHQDHNCGFPELPFHLLKDHGFLVPTYMQVEIVVSYRRVRKHHPWLYWIRQEYSNNDDGEQAPFFYCCRSTAANPRICYQLVKNGRRMDHERQVGPWQIYNTDFGQQLPDAQVSIALQNCIHGKDGALAGIQYI